MSQFSLIEQFKMLHFAAIFFALLFLKISNCAEFYSFQDFNVTAEEFLAKAGNLSDEFIKFEINDESLLKYSVKNCLTHLNYSSVSLYCKPPQILDEENRCREEISVDEWQKVMQSYGNETDGKTWFVYRGEDLSKFEKIMGKTKFNESVLSHFIAISKSSGNGYELYGLRTCYDELQELIVAFNEKMHSGYYWWLLVPQLISIVFFAIMLVSKFTLVFMIFKETVKTKTLIFRAIFLYAEKPIWYNYNSFPGQFTAELFARHSSNL